MTPAPLLTGTLDSCLPADVFIEADGFRRSWRSVQLLLEKMGKGVSTPTPTSSEMVKTLKKSSRWRCRSSTNTKRGDWPKALVTDTFADRDNIVRRVRVRTANSSIMRDVRTRPFRGDRIMRCRAYLCFLCLHLCSDVTFIPNLPSRSNECLSIDRCSSVSFCNC